MSRREDPELEAFLRHRSLTRGERERLEPPPQLDHIVLSRAREALEAEADEEPAAVPPDRSVRWALPFALTATLVMSIAVVTVLKATRGPAVLAGSSAAIAPAQSVPTARAPGSPSALVEIRAAAPRPVSVEPAAPSPARSFTTAAQLSSSVVHAARKSSPQARDQGAWLAEIRALRAAGKNREADAEWAALLSAHPEAAGTPP